MNIQKSPALLIVLLFSSLAFAQNKNHERSVPILTSNANGFAYVEVNPDGIGGSLNLAKTTQTFPTIRAKDVVELENYNSGQYMVYDLGTSPDNRYLVSYRVLSLGREFTDILAPFLPSFDELDILFYDMNTGEYLGFVDDVPFEVLDESLHPSQALEDYRQSQIDAGVPPEVVAEYDYIVHNEQSFTDFFDLHWNTDGTVSVTFLFDVWLIVDNRLNGNIGSDFFTINFMVNPSGVSVESYGDIKTAAAWPPAFDLSVEEPLPGDMQFESRDILFPQRVTHFPGLDLKLYRPKQSAMIAGSIPARYWNF